jgi:hypothetical protein
MKIKFKPNKKVHDNTNQSRALNARRSLTACAKYGSDDEDAVRDLLADLLHYVDFKGFNPDEILRDATDNWKVER